MGIEFAIEELYATGWSALDSVGCEPHGSGRWIPTPERVRREFEQAGYTLSISHAQLFDCYRAAWTDGRGEPVGAVVGASEQEAAIYALSQLRRSLSATA